MVSTNSEFVDFIVPMRERLDPYDPTRPPTDQPRNDLTDPAKGVPEGFINSMIVREEVFVKEQGVLLENELDYDDRRSYAWTAYVSMPFHKQRNYEDGQCHPLRRNSNSTKYPVGTIRLVPPPNTTDHEYDKHRKMDGSPYEGSIKSNVHNGKEPFIKLGRLCLLKDFRKVTNIASLLVDMALTMAKDHPNEIRRPISRANEQELRDVVGETLDMSMDWDGLVCVHAQVGLQKFWAKFGFELDEAVGIWDEEGMDHVCMWKRLDLRKQA